jgi:hypothetical protein
MLFATEQILRMRGGATIAPDVLLGRKLLRRQVPKQSAAPADFGERTAGKQIGGAAGAQENSRCTPPQVAARAGGC